MSYQITPNILFAAACLIYIFSGIFCGIVRWLHMCRPYNQRGEYFYPGRKQATFFFSAVVLQFPYLLNPADTDTWLYIRIFGILYYPVCFSLLLRRYFRGERMKSANSNTFYFSIPFVLIALMLLIILFHEGCFLDEMGNYFLGAMGAVSLMLTFSYIQIAHWLRQKIDKFHVENYSNEEDFPYTFAKQSMYSPLIWIAGMWLIFTTSNHWIKLVLDLICAFWMVLFLCKILHPQRLFTTRERIDTFSDIEKQEEKMMDEELELMSEPQETYMADANSREIREEVLAVILEKYKEPHLQKPDVLAMFSYGKKTEANQFISDVGYYNLVNMFRLEHARQYKKAYPTATQDKIAQESGFTTRFALYKARQIVTEINPDYVNGVRI